MVTKSCESLTSCEFRMIMWCSLHYIYYSFKILKYEHNISMYMSTLKILLCQNYSMYLIKTTCFSINFVKKK